MKYNNNSDTRNNPGGELEHEYTYGVPYDEYSVQVERDIISSESYKRLFSHLETKGLILNNRVVELIYEYTKKAVIENAGTRFESLYLIDIDEGKLLGSIDAPEEKKENHIEYTKDFDNVLETVRNRQLRTIAVHNHPDGYPPSLDDISRIVENGYTLALAAGGNGLLYQYFNFENRVFSRETCDFIHSIIRNDIIHGVDPDRAHHIMYKKLNVGYTIIGGKSYGKYGD